MDFPHFGLALHHAENIILLRLHLTYVSGSEEETHEFSFLVSISLRFTQYKILAEQ